jgi:uncharacterized repeat protein (TIGR02543 family)
VERKKKVSSGGNAAKASPGLTKNKKVILVASAIILTLLAGAILNGMHNDAGQDDERSIGALPDSGLIYRIVDGTSGTFTAEKDDGDGGWDAVDYGTDVAIQNAVDIIKADAGGDDCSIIFWGGDPGAEGVLADLEIAGGSVKFIGTGWGTVSIWGCLTSEAGETVLIQNAVDVESYADISNTAAGSVFNHNGTGALHITGGTVKNAGTGYAVRMTSSGTVTVSEADTKYPTMITAGGLYTIFTTTAFTGTWLEITGGTVQNTGSYYAIQFKNGTVNISGGTVEGEKGAIDNVGTGSVNISGDAVLRGIYETITNRGNGTINIYGGTVGNISPDSGRAIYNYSGTVNISGGIIESNFSTVMNEAAGVLNISGGAVVRAAETQAVIGKGTFNIGDCEIISEKRGYALNTANSNSIIFSGTPKITGTIYVTTTPTASNLTLSDTFEPGDELYHVQPSGAKLGNVTVNNGHRHLDSFVLSMMTKFYLETDGTDLILVDSEPIFRVINATGDNFTGQRDVRGNGEWLDVNSANNTIMRTVLGAIKADAEGKKCELTFWGDIDTRAGTYIPNHNAVTFDGSGVGWDVTIYGTHSAGMITSNTAVILLTNGANVTSYANVSHLIAPPVFYNNGTGTLNIEGGNISSGLGHAVRNGVGGTVNINGGTLSSGNNHVVRNDAGGTVNINGGTFTLFGGTYNTPINAAVGNISAGTVNISGGTMISAGLGIRNDADGTVNISGGSVNPTGNAVQNNAGGTVSISGGTMTSLGNTVQNNAGGTVNISGGTISAAAGAAVRNETTGTVSITGGTLTNTGTGNAAVNISSGKLDISGGTISAAAGAAVRNETSGTVSITGGTMTSAGKYAIYMNTSDGALTFGGTPEIDGIVRSFTSASAAQLTVLPGFAPDAGVYSLESVIPGNGHTAANGGAPFKDSFALVNPGFVLRIAGDDIIMKAIHTVTVLGENTTNDAPPSVVDGETLTFTLTPEEGFGLPLSIIVTMGGETLTDDKYTYDDSTGTVTIPNVIGNVGVYTSGSILYTVTFDPNNGGGTLSEIVRGGTPAERPDDPIYFGWSFLGWFDASGTLWEFTNIVSDDVALRAKWAENPAERFTVTFDPNNGNPVWTVTVPKNTPVERPVSDPIYFGWIFDAWSFDGTPWSFTNNVSGNITILADWSENPDERWNVEFNPDNGNPPFFANVIKGGPAEKPDTPIREGWTFLGWFDEDGASWNFAAVLTDNITLTAKWNENPENQWTVTFNKNDGSEKTFATVTKGTPVGDPGDPSRYGWTFIGWFNGDSKWNFADNVTDNMALAAEWAENMDERFTVTFDMNDGSGTWTVTVPCGEPIAAPNVTRYGWSLIGWYADGAKWDFASAVGSDMVLTAEWAENMDERFTVTFDPNNGDDPWTVTVPKYGVLARPADDPRMNGKAFFAWFDASGVLWSFDSNVIGDMTLRAKWTEAAEKDGGMTALTASLIMLGTLAFILLTLFRRAPAAVRIVTKDGKALAGAGVSYTIDGEAGVGTTDAFGEFAISADIGSGIELTSVNGNPVKGISAILGKRVTELSIEL